MDAGQHFIVDVYESESEQLRLVLAVAAVQLRVLLAPAGTELDDEHFAEATAKDGVDEDVGGAASKKWG